MCKFNMFITAVCVLFLNKLFIHELEPAFNVNVGSEKLMLYYAVLVL